MENSAGLLSEELDSQHNYLNNNTKATGSLVSSSNPNLDAFPVFRPLEIRDAEIIKEAIKGFKPLSAIVFSCLFCWGRPYQISFLNGNIVLRNKEAISDETVYTLLGKNQLINSINAIFSFQEKYQLKLLLKFIPEEMIQHEEGLLNNFCVEIDEKNSDYIYLSKHFSENFSTSHSHHKSLNYFKTHYPQAEFEILDLSHEQAYPQISAVFSQWKINKNKSDEDVLLEWNALNQLRVLADYFYLKAIFLKIDGQIIGFLVFELSDQGYLIGHFLKILCGYRGAEESMYHEMAEICIAEGYEYVNLEEDMGFAGLKEHKLSYHPEFMIRSYTIAPKN